MKISKYRTIGNDYIIVDNSDGIFDEYRDNTIFKKTMNDRIFGIGSTGIAEIKPHFKHPFEMFFHVGTGELGTACGTASMCSVAYARDRGLVEDGKSFHFKSYEGGREATISGNQVTLSMSDDSKIVSHDENEYFIDVRHYVHVKFITNDIEKYDIIKEGKEISLSEKYKSYFPAPTLMLVEICENGKLKARAYDPSTSTTLEFFACGTGTTAVGIAYAKKLGLIGRHEFSLHWRDGIMKIALTRDDADNFTGLELSGEAVHLFDATIDTEKFQRTFKKNKVAD